MADPNLQMGGGGGGGSHLERDIRGRAVSKKNFLPLWDLSLVLNKVEGGGGQTP